MTHEFLFVLWSAARAHEREVALLESREAKAGEAK